jgi:hypothetical protein
MPWERQEVYFHGLHVDRESAGRLGRVHEKRDSFSASENAHLGHGLNHARHVRSMNTRHQPRSGPQNAGEFMQEDSSVFVHGHDINGDPTPGFQRVQGAENRIVFKGGHEDPVAPLPGKPMDRQVSTRPNS